MLRDEKTASFIRFITDLLQSLGIKFPKNIFLSGIPRNKISESSKLQEQIQEKRIEIKLENLLSKIHHRCQNDFSRWLVVSYLLMVAKRQDNCVGRIEQLFFANMGPFVEGNRLYFSNFFPREMFKSVIGIDISKDFFIVKQEHHRTILSCIIEKMTNKNIITEFVGEKVADYLFEIQNGSQNLTEVLGLLSSVLGKTEWASRPQGKSVRGQVDSKMVSSTQNNGQKQKQSTQNNSPVFSVKSVDKFFQPEEEFISDQEIADKKTITFTSG